jgi:cytochrome c oxidase assembly factor CtaG
VLLVLAAIVYARGWGRLHRRHPRRFRWLHLLAFLGGLDALLVAVASPLEAWAAESLPAHMAQHVLLMMVSPPLLWLGAPLAPILRGLPEAAVRPVIACLRWSPIRRASRAVTHPVVGWVSFTAMTWVWHAPAAYELTLRSHAWHRAEHLCFFAAALLFWWPVVQPWPSRAQWPRWTVIPYLLLAEIQNTLLAAVFVFGERILYPTYATIAARAGLSPLDEQIAAGLIMWGPGSLAMVLPAACVTLELLVPARAGPGVRSDQPPPLPPAL